MEPRDRFRTVVTDHLDRLGISFEVKPHGVPVFTSVEAARARGIRVSQIVKTMVAQNADGGLHVAMIPGDRTLKLERLRRVAQDPSITLVNPADLEKRFGLTVGAISPFQLIDLGARFYMDGSVLAEEMVDISSGRPEAGVELSSAQLRHALAATVCDMASRPKA